MVKEIILNYNPCTIQVVIRTKKEEKLWIKVADTEKKNTYYTKRYALIDGVKTFFIRMPQSPKSVYLIVYNDKNKEEKRKNDRSFKVLGINILDLKIKDIQMSKKTKSFIKFAQEFSEEAGVLNASKEGDIYKSNNGRFRMDYFDTIRSKVSGREISTPARISQLTGRIEVSKKQFKYFSVPMRMAILLHEFSHFYVNSKPSSEIQADLNGLTLYLSLGYPRIDAYNVFLNVFKRSGVKNNLNRFQRLDKFIKNWQYGNNTYAN